MKSKEGDKKMSKNTTMHYRMLQVGQNNKLSMQEKRAARRVLAAVELALTKVTLDQAELRKAMLAVAAVRMQVVSDLIK
jgi:hypothetical protein